MIVREHVLKNQYSVWSQAFSDFSALETEIVRFANVLFTTVDQWLGKRKTYRVNKKRVNAFRAL